MFCSDPPCEDWSYDDVAGAREEHPPGPLVVSREETPTSAESVAQVLAPAAPPWSPSKPELAALPRLTLTPPDYNAPATNRTAYHYVRALAFVGVTNYTVWQFNWFSRQDWAYVTRENVRDNLVGGFSWDGNKLPTNFFSHPLHGSVYFGVGRASGLTFWESTAMALLGSASWEYLGETEPPSTNDLITTTLGGIVLGEILFRLSSEVLDDSSSGWERALREVFAGLINPGRGVQRLVDGASWASGRKPETGVAHAAINLGVDRIRFMRDDSMAAYPLRPLVAVQIAYGDWLPREEDGFEPFDEFDLYAALNLGKLSELGAQLYAQGLLVGFSTPFGQDEGAYRDNNVFGLFQSFDFRGARIAQFGGVGVGPGDMLVLRFGADRRLRIGVDLQYLVLGASSSPYIGERTSGYNFLTGITTSQELYLEAGSWGQLGWRSKQYAGTVIDGEPGEEFIGHTRLWYEIDVVRNLGVGFSPSLVHRLSHFRTASNVALLQLETQLYARGRF